MAKVIPFRGVRYNPNKIDNLQEVIAPPYDVVKPQERVALENKHPNNVVRLILSQPRGGDTEANNQYTRAATRLRNWRSDEVLIQDTAPCYYVYDQTATTLDGETYTRRALIGAGRLEPFGSGTIFPHEKTLAAPKADRLNLIRQCHTNLSPIFLLYSDPKGTIEAAMSDFTAANRPVVEIPEIFGSAHRLWQIDDTQMTQKIQTLFESKSLVIADGHHRYETALVFRDEIRAQSADWTGEEGYNYTMMNLVQMESPGLMVFAIHRLLSGLNPSLIEEAINRLPTSFDVTTYHSLNALVENLRALVGQAAFGLYAGGDLYHLLVPPMAQNTSTYDRLDATLLHRLVIENLFGLDITNPDHQKQVSYTVNTDDAIGHVKDASGRVALFMNPTQVSHVNEVATSGQTMPQKSTYFYPKMATGFVLNPLVS